MEPRVELSQLDADLISWVMYPRTKVLEKVELGHLAIVENSKLRHDWLLMSIKPQEQLPAYPLRARQKPAQVGEDVFLVGVPYSEPDAAQNIYRGKVLTREHGDNFRYSVDPPVDIRGFSGAPVLDADGFVLGVMGIWFKPRQESGKDVESGAEDIATALTLLTPKS